MDTVELRDMMASSPPPELELKDDIIKLSMMGDEVAVKALLDRGEITASWTDSEGIGPLHWAAINNRYAVCKLLIERGADVNAKGGDSVSTPAMWAAQRGHYYIVNLLLRNGADPLLADSSGYNILHLATFDGNLLLLVLLLHQGIPVDCRDPLMHTSLMWAAYKGYASSVDLFLRWGADIHAVDDNGFTALHWAIVRGNFGCIQKLIEYGSDRFARNSEGKTPAIVAEELKTQRVWWDALGECGYDRDGNPLHPTGTILGVRVQDKTAVLHKFFFCWPTVIIWAVTTCLVQLPWFLGVPVAGAVGAGFHWVADKALDYGDGEKAMYKTPYLAGIFGATAFWIAERWIFHILPNTFGTVPFSNIFFGIAFGFCVYFYIICMLYDPGYIPKLSSVTEQKAVIEELITLWKYDSENFCVQCMVRMPLRAKHCKRCARCVAKHDHHCPWVFNCIGVKNHRQFFLFVFCLEIGIFILVNLVISHFSLLAPIELPECSILAEPFCSPVLQDPFTAYICLWGCLQTTWVTMLLVVQLVQIARAQTTYESMHGNRHGHHHHFNEHKVAATIASTIAAGSSTMDGAQLTPGHRGPDPAVHRQGHGHGHHRPRGDTCWTKVKKALGVGAFVNITSDRGNASRRRGNPFSRGIITNCKDFWCDPAPLLKPSREGGGEALLGGGVVDYFNMYETPPRMRMRGGGGGGAAGRYQRLAEEEEEV